MTATTPLHRYTATPLRFTLTYPYPCPYPVPLVSFKSRPLSSLGSRLSSLVSHHRSRQTAVNAVNAVNQVNAVNAVNALNAVAATGQ
jgi:hypothetical protein